MSMYNTPPQADAPNLRKRPSRGASSKYITKPQAVSPPPMAVPAASPFPVTRNYATMDTSALTSSFMLSSPIMPMTMPVPSGPHSSFAAKRKAVKFPERNLPEKISTFIPESKLYTALLDFEKKLDLSLTRRQLDVQEAMRVRNTLKQSKIIRLSIYNTYAHQSGVYHLDNKTQATSNEPASWTLRIEGRVEDPAWSRAKLPKKKFSSFVKKAFFQLGDDVNNTIEWDRAVASSETDGWEIKRAGDQEIEVKITLFLEHSPSKVKLSPLLSALLNMHTETRPRILMLLWQYIKANRLLDANDRKTINCDENLKIVFGCETMQFADIPKHLRNHLSPPDPIEISHTIKLSGDPMEHMAVYDIMIEVDDTVAIQPSPVYKKELSNIEEQIAQVIHQVHTRKRKRDFMLEFYNDPVVFLNKLVDNQIKDYKLAHAYPGRDPEEERKTSFFYQPYVEDAVQSYIAKQVAQQPHVKVNLPIPPPASSSSSSSSSSSNPPSTNSTTSTTSSTFPPSLTSHHPLSQPSTSHPSSSPPLPSSQPTPPPPLPLSLTSPHLPTPPPPLPLPSSLQASLQQPTSSV